MPSGVQVVESIEDEGKALEPRNVEFVVLDVRMVRCDLDVWIEYLCSLLGNLDFCQLPGMSYI
jgi:hypothetical protein